MNLLNPPLLKIFDWDSLGSTIRIVRSEMCRQYLYKFINLILLFVFSQSLLLRVSYFLFIRLLTSSSFFRCVSLSLIHFLGLPLRSQILILTFFFFSGRSLLTFELYRFLSSPLNFYLFTFDNLDFLSLFISLFLFV